MKSIADSDHRVIGGDVAPDPRAARGARGAGRLRARRSGRVLWAAWAGFGGHWLSAPDSYWRRRFLILASGLVVFCLITWGASMLLGPANPIGRAAAAQVGENRMTLPPAAYGPPSTTPSPASAVSSAVSPTSTPGTPSASGPGPTVLAGSASPGQSPSAAVAPGQCPPASVVLSLFSAQPRYSPSQQPRFTVYVVSTAPGTCRMPYLPPFARVIVTRNGEVVWDSASCVTADDTAAGTGGAAQQMTLTEGVPKVITLSWDRKATSPGCGGSLPAGASGTFDVVAIAGGKSSPVAAISLTPK